MLDKQQNWQKHNSEIAERKAVNLLRIIKSFGVWPRDGTGGGAHNSTIPMLCKAFKSLKRLVEAYKKLLRRPVKRNRRNPKICIKDHVGTGSSTPSKAIEMHWGSPLWDSGDNYLPKSIGHRKYIMLTNRPTKPSRAIKTRARNKNRNQLLGQLLKKRNHWSIKQHTTKHQNSQPDKISLGINTSHHRVRTKSKGLLMI